MDLQAALDVARTCKQPPGKAKANECLKLCRLDMHEVGEIVEVEDAMPEFHWRAYLANHPQRHAIFKSAVTSFFAEAFPEVDPNASKLTNKDRPNAGGLRVDFVVLRESGCVRLHPGKHRDAIIVEGSLDDLEQWRRGRKSVHMPAAHAIKTARFSQQPPPPPPGPPPAGALASILESVEDDGFNPDDSAPQIIIQRPEATEHCTQLSPDDSASQISIQRSEATEHCTQLGNATHPFDPTEFNSSQSFHYIALHVGDEVEMTNEDGPWAYGSVKDKGWFPRDSVKLDAPVFLPSQSGSVLAGSVTSQASSISIGWVSPGSSSDCFAPETMFLKHVGLPNLQYELVSAMSLAEGDDVLSAHGELLTKVKRKVLHPQQHVLEVHVGDARLRVTPSHRVSVPIGGGYSREAMAKDLKVGDLVMTSHEVQQQPISQIVPIEFCESCSVFAITFEPDVSIISYFPPSLAILSLGQTPRTLKPTRRSGMNRRTASDVLSIPDTEPGLYRD